MATELENIRRKVDVIQSMIDISTDRLEALRTQCATSAELTQQEIRTLESKLVKMFAELLIAKSKLVQQSPKEPSSTGAELKQWLKVVGLYLFKRNKIYNSFTERVIFRKTGLNESSMDAVWQRVSTLELLLDQSNSELRQLIRNSPVIDENEILRWQRAMFNLKRCHQSMLSGNTNTTEPTDLSWTYWNDSITPKTDIQQKTNETDPAQLSRTQFKRGPLIAHRFTKKFRALSTCDYCNKQMFFGLKCIECKYSCHKDCEASVPPSCGVPMELLSEFKQTFNLDAAPQFPLASPDIIDAGNGFFFSTARHSNNKKPSTSTPETVSMNVQRRQSHTLATLKNYFEEISSQNGDHRTDTIKSEETSTNQKPNKKTLSFKAPEIISLSESIGSSLDSIPYSDSTEDRQCEWGIQFDDIRILDKIGTGRFGTVHRAQWYGDCCVKLLNANYLDDAQSLEAFKNEVATFKNTRHENLVLFMGFCMKPQAIVTSLCKGKFYVAFILLKE